MLLTCRSIPSSLSKVTPRFLSEVEDSIQCSPIVIVLVSIFAWSCLDPSHKTWVLSEFSFSRFDFHSSFYSFNAFSQSKSNSWLVDGWALEVKLAVIGAGVNSKWCGNGDDIRGVQDEEERSQNWSLWHVVFPCGLMTFECNRLRSTLDKWWDPCQCCSSDTIRLL